MTDHRVDQLKLVYSKAMDVTFESLGPDDIKRCFGDLRKSFGSSLDGKLVQQLALSKNRLQGQFDELCEEYDLTKNISTHSKEESLRSLEDIIESTALELSEIEGTQMERLILHLEKENKMLEERCFAASKRIDEQIAAVKEEENKMEIVADQL